MYTKMKRAQIYFSEEQWALLKKLSQSYHEGISDLVRRAVDKSYRLGYRPDELLRALNATAGIWKNRTDVKDGIASENKIRKNWRTPDR